MQDIEEKLYAFYKQNQDFADTCAEYQEDPPGEMMYDAFVEYIAIMELLEDYFTYTPTTP